MVLKGSLLVLEYRLVKLFMMQQLEVEEVVKLEEILVDLLSICFIGRFSL